MSLWATTTLTTKKKQLELQIGTASAEDKIQGRDLKRESKARAAATGEQRNHEQTGTCDQELKTEPKADLTNAQI
jgi:hypothetical protein